MGAWFTRKPSEKSALGWMPIVLVAVFAIGASGVTALRGRRPRGDATDILTGNRDVSVDSLGAPVASVADQTNKAFDLNDFGAAGQRPKPLPVWPPPPVVSAADPAANAMIGAPPMRVDWPGPLPSSHGPTTGKAIRPTSEKPADKPAP